MGSAGARRALAYVRLFPMQSSRLHDAGLLSSRRIHKYLMIVRGFSAFGALYIYIYYTRLVSLFFVCFGLPRRRLYTWPSIDHDDVERSFIRTAHAVYRKTAYFHSPVCDGADEEFDCAQVTALLRMSFLLLVYYSRNCFSWRLPFSRCFFSADTLPRLFDRTENSSSLLAYIYRKRYSEKSNNYPRLIFALLTPHVSVAALALSFFLYAYSQAVQSFSARAATAFGAREIVMDTRRVSNTARLLKARVAPRDR